MQTVMANEKVVKGICRGYTRKLNEATKFDRDIR